MKALSPFFLSSPVRIGCLCWGVLLLVTLLPAGAAGQGVCGRTPQVRDKILEYTGVGNCAEVTAEDLAGIDSNWDVYFAFDLSNAGLSELKLGDFDGLVRVRGVELILNKLTILPEGLFREMAQLRYVRLAGNRLTSLPEGLFRNNPKFSNLWLQDNQLTSLPVGLFYGLTDFATFYAGGNQLTSLPEGLFRDNPGMEDIWLQDNQLTSLPEGLFRGVNRVEKINGLQILLSNNQLTSLPGGIFQGLDNLLLLWMAHNRLTTLPEGVFHGLAKLESLLLQGNSLRRLPEDLFQGLVKLRVLWLSSSRVGTLPPGIFKGLPDLWDLDLYRMDLTELPVGIFDELPSLLSLRLERNSLASLPEGIFDRLDSLVELRLQANPALRLSPGVFNEVLDTLGADGAVPEATFPGKLVVDPHLHAELAFEVSAQQVSASDLVQATVTLSRALPVALRVPFTVTAGHGNGGVIALAPSPEEGLLFRAGETRKQIRFRFAHVEGDRPGRATVALSPLDEIGVRRADGSGPDAPYLKTDNLVLLPDWGARHTVRVAEADLSSQALGRLAGKQLIVEVEREGQWRQDLVVRFDPDRRFEVTTPGPRRGAWAYRIGGPSSGVLTLNYEDRQSCQIELDFVSGSTGIAEYPCSDGTLLRGRFRLTREPSLAFVPVVLTAAGLNNAFFTTELTLTNRGSRPAELTYRYRPAVGQGTGTASEVLGAGQQKIVPDALEHLRSLGVPIAASGNRLGTLEVDFPTDAEVAVMARVTTSTPDGRAGLAYPAVRGDRVFHEAVYLCGLRQDGRDRSNLAFQNVGAPGDGPITLRTSVYSGDTDQPSVTVLDDVTLAPGGFHQYSGVLGGVSNGYVKVERVSGLAGFYAYGVINDQANGDGSFVFPVRPRSLSRVTEQALPVLVESGTFGSELVLTNFSSVAKTIKFTFVTAAIERWSRHEGLTMTVEAGEQRLIPDIVDLFRDKPVPRVPPRGPTIVGPLFALVEVGDMSGLVIAARTGSPGGGGQYSVFYNAVPEGQAFIDTAWVYGLQQDAHSRSNLALVKTDWIYDFSSWYRAWVDIFDGATGQLVTTVGPVTLFRERFHQFNSILANYAPGVAQGYVRIRVVPSQPGRPFFAYGIINDGGAPGQGSGDGAYLPGQPE